MKNYIKNTLVVTGVLALLSVAFITLKGESQHASKKTFIEPGIPPIVETVSTQTAAKAAVTPPAPTAPFITKDTDNDSPGTNLVTRIITLMAEIGGAQPLQLQWQVDKGSGFVDIPGATNATYRIGNAQVEYNGFYVLTATNSLGGLRTTPQQLIVWEGED